MKNEHNIVNISLIAYKLLLKAYYNYVRLILDLFLH